MLPPEHAFVLADEDSPSFLPGAFELMTARVRDEPQITEAFRSGAGVGWHEHDHGLFDGTERFFRPGYRATWCSPGFRRSTASRPSCARGATRRRRRLRPRRLDDPHGAGLPGARRSSASTTTPARSSGARARARGRARRSRPLRGRAGRAAIPGALRPRRRLRLPARHGRPGRRGARTSAARSADDGTWLIVEPFAGDTRRGEPQPGRADLLRGVDAALHAGVALAGGRARRSAPRPARRGCATSSPPAASPASGARRETPFNLVLEARP